MVLTRRCWADFQCSRISCRRLLFPAYMELYMYTNNSAALLFIPSRVVNTHSFIPPQHLVELACAVESRHQNDANLWIDIVIRAVRRVSFCIDCAVCRLRTSQLSGNRRSHYSATCRALRCAFTMCTEQTSFQTVIWGTLAVFQPALFLRALRPVLRPARFTQRPAGIK